MTLHRSEQHHALYGRLFNRVCKDLLSATILFATRAQTPWRIVAATKAMSASNGSARCSRRKLFAPTPIGTSTSSRTSSHTASVAATSEHDSSLRTPSLVNGVESDAALAASMSASEVRRSYSLRRRTRTASTSSTSTHTHNATQSKSKQTSAKRSRAALSSCTASEEESDSAAGSDFCQDEANDTSDHDSDVFGDDSTTNRKNARASTSRKTSRKIKADYEKESSPKQQQQRRASKSVSLSPKKRAASSPFSISPRKVSKKAWKVNLEAHEAHPAPLHWEEVYALLAKQRTRIVAPVDTMGCEENGRQHRRADAHRARESPEASAKRERLATLVSLMLSSQTKDPVTAEAVYNLQRTLPNGLCLQSLLDADDEMISQCISKVGFWRRKTGYLKSAARILADDFQGDVPRTVDELVSLPGVGPKMAFLALSSMGIQVGIGVDTHVHRLTNRLGWHKTKTPEETRLNLQSWLPTQLHANINRLLVGFGQVICVPVGPRCDLCDVGRAGLCPSFRKVDPKSIEKRVKVEMLASDHAGVALHHNSVKLKSESEHTAEARLKVELQVDDPHNTHILQVADLIKPQVDQQQIASISIKQEDDTDTVSVDKALDW